MKTYLVIFGPLLFGATAFGAPLPLTDTVRYALEHSPALDAASRSTAVAELNETNASVAFFPKLDLVTTAGFSRTKLPNQPVAENPLTSSLSVALSESLYDNNVSITQYRISKLTREIARIDFERARAQLCLDVATNFYKLSASRMASDIAAERLRTLSRQFQSVSAQYRQGLKTRKDFLRFKAQVQRAEIDQITATNDIRVAEAELKRLVGVPLATDDQTLAFASLPATSAADPSRDAPKNSPPLDQVYSFRTARLSREVNELNETFAKRNYWPQVSVTAAAAYSNNNYLGRDWPKFADTNALSWNGQVNLTYNIWDWGTLRRKVEIAEHTRAISDDTLDLSNLALRRDIESLMLELSRLVENYKLSRELLELSQQSYDFLAEEYRQGKIAYLDIITALNDLLDAKGRYYAAHYGLLQSIAQYRYYQGNLYESLFAQTQSR